MTTEDDVRRIALALPSTFERPSYGSPGFRVQDRLFARVHEEPGVLVVFRSSVEDRDELIASAPANSSPRPTTPGTPVCWCGFPPSTPQN